MVGPQGFIDFKGDRKAYLDIEKMWSLFEEKEIREGIWIWDRKVVVKKNNRE